MRKVGYLKMRASHFQVIKEEILIMSSLRIESLPRFDILPEEIEKTIDRVLSENRAKIAELLDESLTYTWQNLITPLERWNDELQKIWAPISHLNAVQNTAALRAAYHACLPKLALYHTELGQNLKLYRAYQEIAEGPEFNRLDEAQREVIRQALRDFRLEGVSLEEKEQQQFCEIQKRLAELCSRFSDNVLDATHAWKKHITDVSVLAGLSETALNSIKMAAEREKLTGYLLTLDFPCYSAVITYADDRQLREEIYRAYVTRASDQGPQANRFDNSKLMEEILTLRHTQAKLLGFHNYAELSLATKMADSPQTVLDFLQDLVRRGKPQAQREIKTLQEFAAKQGCDVLQAWDLAYYSERLRLEEYRVSQEALRPYFPEEKVLQGLFAVVNQLYGVVIKERLGVPTWHANVRYFDVFNDTGEQQGGFYCDLYARPDKRGGAWMDECQVRFRLSDSLQLPLAFLTCNFSAAQENQPCLMTHDEVLTLFHEFGHTLHHLLTQINYPAVAGINGVPWDAVELPSQFMENWCWQRETMPLISGHYKTGEPLPLEQLDRLLAAKNFQSAMQLMRQLEFSLFDFRLHAEYGRESKRSISTLLEEVRAAVSVFSPPAFNRFQHSFTHVFGGGYAAGYYSYKWAEVLSADAFSRFEEEGIFNVHTGRDFLDKILAKGGSVDPMSLFINFRGRKPTIEALLRHDGILTTTHD